MQSTDTAFERHEKTLEERAAAILSGDVQGWILNGDIHWVPNEVLRWFADYMKSEAQLLSRRAGITLSDDAITRARSFVDKAVAELGKRGEWGVEH